MLKCKFVNVQCLRPSLKPNLKKRPNQCFKYLNTSLIQYGGLKRQKVKQIDRQNSFDNCIQQKVDKKSLNQTLLTDIYFHRDYNDLASSYSFQQQEYYEQQKQIFCKFLQNDFQNWLEFVHQMNQIEWQKTKILDIVKIGRTQLQEYQNRKLAHFIGIWLYSMKYKQSHTKFRVIQNVKLRLNKFESGPNEIAQKMYDNLMKGFLPSDLQLRFLLQTCKRGWQYFSFTVCRLIKIIPKIQQLEYDQLYEELKLAINS